MIAAGHMTSAPIDASRSQPKRTADQDPSCSQAPSEPSCVQPGLPDVEARLESAAEAGTAASLQAAIWYAVRTMAAANPSTCDLSQVESASELQSPHRPLRVGMLLSVSALNIAGWPLLMHA